MEVKAIMMNFMDNMEEMAKKGAKDSKEESRAQTSIESTVLASKPYFSDSDTNRACS